MRVGLARRRMAGLLALALAGAVLASCGGTGGDGAGSSGTTAATTTTVKRSTGSPRWETVTTFKGSGTTNEPTFDILGDAIQWRVRWRCEAGSLRILTDPPPRRKGPVVDSGCPANGEGFSIATGKVRLTVEATAAWELTIDQQVDTPLEEPPLPSMDQAKVVAEGAFYNVEMSGKGTAKLFLMPDG